MKHSNFLVFLVKTAVLFLVFWLLNGFLTNSTTIQNMPNWGVWLILAAVASAIDWVVDVLVKPDSKLGNYAQYTRIDRD